MNTVARKHKWFKEITLTKADQIYVGLGVHKSSISVAVWLNGRIEHTFRSPADYSPLIDQLNMLRTALKMVSYEAGPTGYGLARTFQKASLPMQVVSPSNIQRPSKRSSKRLRAMTEETPHAKAIDILTSHPGIGIVTSWAFHTEIFRPQRCNQASEIASFVGLAPRIIQSCQSCREGPITKCGREQLRSKLIEASWVWIRHDHQAHQVYVRLCGNTGNSNKAIVGMAGRLAIHLWHMLCNKQYYHKPA